MTLSVRQISHKLRNVRQNVDSPKAPNLVSPSANATINSRRRHDRDARGIPGAATKIHS